MTVLEILIVVAVLGILTMIAAGMMHGRIAKARLARCMVDLRSVQSTVYAHSDGGWPVPDQSTFWDIAWSGMRPGPYHYLTDAEDGNCGHGNDLDGFDEQNPGNAPRRGRDIHFVVLCGHDHGELGWYVYIEDEGPPLIATHDDHPGYHRFIGRGGNGGGNGNGGGGPGGGGNGGGGNGGGGPGGGGNGNGGGNGGGPK